ncbi:MAG: c-type cytochrome [Balneolaceae bacterium]
MKKVLKISGFLLAGVLVLLSGLLIYVKAVLPNTGPATDLTVEITPERVERGEYLAHSVMVCMDCHSERDFSLFSGPLVSGTLGKGGERFDANMGFPGNFYARNLTPYNIGDWTDGELFRAITTGVNKEGKALFPVMPYLNYGKIDKEDVYDIIAYIRSLDPIEHDVTESVPDFPMNFIINTIPTEAEFTQKPDPSDRVAYGKYLVTAASCNDCHTKMEQGTYVEGMEFAGGFEFQFPSGEMTRSANITPDKKTGIGSWTEDQFVNRFKAYVDTNITLPKVAPGQFNTPMPWTMYATMKEDDLRAIYTYLQTVKPIENLVTRYTPASK